jgi:ribose/xylose/arabinose/galactoside ABC-type transport system permease subunit
MAYDDSRFRGEPGFRDEPDFRSDSTLSDATTLAGGEAGSPLYAPANYSPAHSGSTTDQTEGTVSLGRRGVSQAQLDDVFDDPTDGEPGRDRMAVHAVWEILLLAAVAGGWYLLRRADPGAVRGAGLRDLMVSAAALGLVTAGIGLSLRAAAPNLAVGPVAVGAGLFFADHNDRGTATTAVVTALLAAAVGVALAILVVGFHVPGWAASLAVAFGVIVWIQLRSDDITLDDAYQPTRHAAYWFLGFAVIALLGSLLGATRSVRRAVGRFRPVADPARRRGGAAAALTTLALVASCALAGVGGILMALHARIAAPGTDALGLAGLALGAALVGGTSAYGRRGGLFGTVFAVTLMVIVIRYAEVTDRRVAPLAFAAGAIALGLVVTRLVETFGRPKFVGEDEADGDWSAGTSTTASDSAGWSSRPGGWTSPLPARTGDDGWGSDDRWGGR